MEPRGEAQAADLERRLRRCLTDQAARVRPAGVDLAEHATRAGRRRQRWRHGLGTVAVVMATVLALGGPQLTWPSPAVPAPQLWAEQVAPHQLAQQQRETLSHGQWAQAVPIALISVEDGARPVLATGGGEAIVLRYLTGVSSAHRQPGGWAVVADRNGEPSLWHVAEREQSLLLSHVDAVAVDRTQVAWRRGSVLAVGELSGGELRERSQVELTGPVADPVGFIGDVVVLEPEPSGEQGGDESAAPSRLAWRPTGNPPDAAGGSTVREVFGALPERGTALGLAQVDDEVCLAWLEVRASLEPGAGPEARARPEVSAGLEVQRTSCPPTQPLAGRPAAVSPDGQWLLAAAADGEATTVPVLVDVSAALAGEPDATELVPAPPPIGEPVWPDSEAVVYPVPGGVTRVWPDRVLAGAADAVAHYGVPGDPVLAQMA